MTEKTQRRGESETDGVREEGGRGGEGELVTESLTEHISIFLIIPLDESCERERPGAGEMVEEGGRERGREREGERGRQSGRERNQTQSDLMCPAVGMCVCVCDLLVCDVCVRESVSLHVFAVLQGRSSESGMSARDAEPRQIVCTCV